ncbi:MAG: class I SAM-dependent methyltransferase [Anaerolineae bacterium]
MSVFGKEIAAHYEAWYETPQGRAADRQEKNLFRQLMAAFPGAQTVLEIGCGTGHFTRWLRDEGFQALGLDLSMPMLAQAQALDGLPLVRGDAHRLPFADGAVDLAVLITTLEFLDHPQEALAEALRVARQGILLGVLNRWSPLGLARRLASRVRPSVYRAAHFYGVGELRRLVRSVAGPQATVIWRTTLFPWGILRRPSLLPWGGFTGMAVVK